MARRGARYLGVLRGSNERARSQLISYFRGEITPQYSARRGPRPERRLAYVRPFNLGVAPNKFLVQEVNAVRFETVRAFATNFTFTSEPVVADRISVPGLLADRAVITTGRSGQGTRRDSQLTGNTYLSYGGDAVVVPFGRSAVAMVGSPSDVFGVITTRATNANPLNTVQFIPSSWS